MVVKYAKFTYYFKNLKQFLFHKRYHNPFIPELCLFMNHPEETEERPYKRFRSDRGLRGQQDIPPEDRFAAVMLEYAGCVAFLSQMNFIR